MTKPKKKRSILIKFRNYFFAGIVVLIPIGFTLYITKILISISSNLIPKNINPNHYLPFNIPGVEIIISVIFITIIGGISLSFFGNDFSFTNSSLFAFIVCFLLFFLFIISSVL